MGSPIPPKLPRSAPQALKDFVACRRDDVELDPAQAGWIPKPKQLPDAAAPTTTVTPGERPQTATISVGWGFVSISLPVSISGGHLAVDTSQMSMFDDLVAPIQEWVKQLNDVLDANGKALDDLVVLNGKVRLRKRRIGATTPAPSTTAPPPPPTPTAPAPTPPSTPAPAPAPVTPVNPGSGCLTRVLLGLMGLLVLGGGVILVTRGSDDDTSASSTTATTLTIAPPTTSAPVATTVAATTTTAVTTTTTLPPHAVPPLLITGRTVGVDHSRGVTDAVTGQAGRSTAVFGVEVVVPGGGTAVVRIASQCGTDLLTGEATVESGRAATVEQPLLQYGPCQVRSSKVMVGSVAYELPPEMFGTSGLYLVDGRQPSADVPDADLWAALVEFWARASANSVGALDVLDALGEGPIDPECLALIAPRDGLLLYDDQHDCAAAGRSRARVVATDVMAGSPVFGVGVFANPDGAFAPDPRTYRETDHWGPLFRFSVFPCGAGTIGFTVCPTEDGTDGVGAFVAASLQFPEDLPTVPAPGAATISLTATGTGATWRLSPGAGAWVLESDGPTSARVILRGASLTLVAPQDEAGTTGFTYTIDRPGSPPVTGDIAMTGALHT